MLRVQTPPLPAETREQLLLRKADEMGRISETMLDCALSMINHVHELKIWRKRLDMLVIANLAVSATVFLTSAYLVFR